MRLTMKSIYQLLGETFTPSLLAMFNVGMAAGLTVMDDSTSISEELHEEAVAYLRNESPAAWPFRSGIGFSTESGKVASVPLGPDYLTAALAFIAEPNAETLKVDEEAYAHLVGHVERIGEKL